ncbi:MAG TPA: hypothetical protein VGY53_06700 [Isosphaeraceae bacterium]|nr:hypothetical protein [Isosphaeraceae bacterium]
MERRIKDTSKRLRRIRVTSPKLERVDPEKMAEAIGAERVESGVPESLVPGPNAATNEGGAGEG